MLYIVNACHVKQCHVIAVVFSLKSFMAHPRPPCTVTTASPKTWQSPAASSPLHGEKMHLERVVTDGDFIFANVYASGFFVLFKGFYSFVRIFLFASSLIGYCVHHQVCSCSCQTARTGGSKPTRVECRDRLQIEDVQHTHLLGDRQEPRAQHDLGLEKQIVPVRV